MRVVIEEETAPASSSENAGAFGMWRDRGDMADIEGYVRNLRAPRYEHPCPRFYVKGKYDVSNC